MANQPKPTCPLCGMFLDSRHTLMSCATNQGIFNISMGMYETEKPDEKKDGDNSNAGAIITSCVLLLMIAYFVIQKL